MTVQGEPTGSVPDAAQLFTDLHREHVGRVTRFIYSRLGKTDYHLAEDLTSETFSALWFRFLDRGEEVKAPLGLLYTLARWQIGDYFGGRSKKANWEQVLDVTDPVNTPLVITGHVYAAERPDLAILVTDLEEAMDRMTAASKAWRNAHKASNRQQRFEMTDDDLLVDVSAVGEWTAEDETLQTFRKACAEVAELRAELETAAGPHWRASMPPPTSGEGSAPARGYAGRRAAPRKKNAADLKLEAGVERAKAMLLDPNCTLTLGQIAEAAGISYKTIQTRLKAESVLHRRKSQRPVESALRKARGLLLDPNCTLTLYDIGKEVGLADATILRSLPDDVAQHRQQEAARKAALVDKVRQLLNDTETVHSLASICRTCGVNEPWIKRNLAEEKAAYSARLAAKTQQIERDARRMLADPDCDLSLENLAKACGTSDRWIRKYLPAEAAARKARRAATPALVGATR